MLIFSLMGEKSKSKDTLTGTTWPEVSPEDTLITPEQCKVLWEYFNAELLTQTQGFNSGLAATNQVFATLAGAGATLATVAGGGD
ncbi:Root hair defective 3 GTP-binding protein [Corchorus olitorius]|uniref:Root hair defective 3 GTP-binding protein n=1 Tax=Corchorus olitorius TaxID=93759 RepID=A0A1R3JPW8_9ROSI|nr:Root hair defective 3 GTP-binding protein [Corchorus olitorius]